MIQLEEGKNYRVDKNGCWVWLGRLNAGYAKHGRLRVIQLLIPSVPPKAERHHKCENKACVNLDHVEVLSPAQHRRKHHRVNISDADELVIVARRKTGESYAGIGFDYRTNSSMIHRICKRHK